jgi:peptidoglycan/LPS O-acetylase OafA/YrhL
VRFANIQVLRLVAATGVVLFHLGAHAPALVGVNPSALRHAWVGGFAVPLFFAVSGFVLTHAARSTTTARFLAARFLRLYPGFWLAALGAAAFWRYRLYNEDHRWLVYFVSRDGLALWPPGPGHAVYLLGVEWSLVYEVFLSAGLAALGLAGARRLPALAGAWLALILAKAVLWPGYAFDLRPHWSTIAASAYNAPFLLGVLAYQLKDRGRRWRWAVLPAVLLDFVVVPARPMTAEWHWVHWGVWSAAVVWLAVQFRQLPDRNPLVRLGDCTYGLFLFHVPLMLMVFYRAAHFGWVGRVEVVWAGGAVALAGGLLFGRLESAVHARLRPLAKLRVGDVTAGWGRLRARFGRPAGRV